MKKLIILILLGVVASYVQAADDSIRPGIWEITTTSDLLNYASQIPPDKMQELGALAKEYGFEMPKIENGAAKTKSCITPEMAAQKIMPNSFQVPPGCIIKSVSHSGNNYHAEYTCENQQVKGNGVADGTFTTPENFRGHAVFDGLVQNTPINETADIVGKWVSANCNLISTQ